MIGGAFARRFQVNIHLNSWNMKETIQRDFFIAKLEEELLKLPSYMKQDERNDSWMTSREIAECFSARGYGEYNEDDIESFLLDELKKGNLINIRSAKYPNLLNMDTLWGHHKNLFPLSEENLPWKTTDEEKLDDLDIAKDAPRLFLSHSYKDFEFAKEVRQMLATHGFNTWMFENELGKGSHVFGAVKLGIIHCDAVVVLLTSNSLGSAWIDTEAQSANTFYKKKVITLINGNDKDLFLVVTAYLNKEGNVQTSLDTLLEKYKQMETGGNRIDSFKKNATNILGFLHLYSDFSVYPPMPGDSNNKMVSIEEALKTAFKNEANKTINDA